MKLFAVRRQTTGERGAATMEYALMAALLVLACIASLTVMGNQAGGSIKTVAKTIQEATGGNPE